VFSVAGRFWPLWGDVNYLRDKNIQEKVRNASHMLNLMINGFWILNCDIPSLTKPGKMRLEILDENGKARKDVVISYPRQIFPAG
jgi:hypothetical protein